MTQLKIECGCGRTLTANGSSGRGAYRCGCRARIFVTELPESGRRCTYGDCRTLATTKEPLRFCPEHEERAAVLLAGASGAAKLQELQDAFEASRSTRLRRYGHRIAPLPRATDEISVVYFARRETLIKIGTSVRLRRRMHSLNAEVLATEPGDLVRERQLHRHFGHLLASGREWFNPGSDLIDYINQLRKKTGSAPIAP